MGILDDLKQQADQARRDKEQEEARRAELRQLYDEGIRPAIVTIHKYLLDLVEQLTAVTWQVHSSFEFPGIGRVDKLEQRDYLISIDSQRNPKSIILRFDCVCPEEKRYELATRALLDEASQFLLAQKVTFSDWALRDAYREISGFVIQAKLRVRTTLAFDADIENGAICVTAVHFQGITEKRFTATYQSINDEWLDQLGHYILRKNTEFGRLDISEEERKRIRLLLDEERKRYEAYIDETPREIISEDGLLPRLRKLFAKPIR